MNYSIAILLTFMFCLWLNKGFGQQDVNKNADSSKKVYFIRDAASVYPKAPLYIINDKEIADSLASSNQALKSINVNDILKISTLKDAEASALYGVRGANGVIIITTKGYAIKKYQEKLSLKSKKYAVYLEKHLNDDKQIVYIINGNILNGVPIQGNDIDNVTKKLYEIPFKNITKVKYSDNYVEGMKNGGVVTIETVNKNKQQ